MDRIPSKTCLFVVYEAGNVPSAIPLVHRIAEKTGRRTVVYCPYYLPDTSEYRRLASDAGSVYINGTTELGGHVDVLGQLCEHFGLPQSMLDGGRLISTEQTKRSRAARQVIEALPTERADVVDDWVEFYQAQFVLAAQVVALLDVDVCFLAEENVERDSWAWVRATHGLDGTAIVMSYAVATPEEALVPCAADPGCAVAGQEGRLLAKRLGQWVLTYEDRLVSRLPIERALAMERLGGAPSLPWVVNTGDADAIAVESDFMVDQFAARGIARSRLHAVGHPLLDEVGAWQEKVLEVKARLVAEAGVDAVKRLAVCALPPSQYPHRPAAGFDTYESLLVFILTTLTETRNFSVVATPHPTIPADVLEGLETRGFKLLRGATTRLVPAADLYVASSSTTIKWARACGKPVVDYDCYEYGYADYRIDPAVYSAASASQFRDEIRRLDDPEVFAESASSAEGRAEYWGRLDGRSIERIVSLVDDLITAKRAR